MIGIIFDCDGTLIDSEHAHFLSWQQVLLNRGINLTFDEYLNFSKQPFTISQLICEQFDLASPHTLLEEKKACYRMNMKENVFPISKNITFLMQLFINKQKLNVKLGLASAAPKDDINLNLKHLNLENIFDVIVSGVDDLSMYSDQRGTNKPQPYIYTETTKLLNLEPQQCFAFEDSYAGICSAGTAGLITFAVPNSFTLNHDFSSANFVLNLDEKIDMDSFFQKIYPFMTSEIKF